MVLTGCHPASQQHYVCLWSRLNLQKHPEAWKLGPSKAALWKRKMCLRMCLDPPSTKPPHPLVKLATFVLRFVPSNVEAYICSPLRFDITPLLAFHLGHLPFVNYISEFYSILPCFQLHMIYFNNLSSTQCRIRTKSIDFTLAIHLAFSHVN